MIEPIVAHFPGGTTPLTARQVDLLESLAKHVQAGGNPTVWRQERVNLVETGDQGVVATCPACGLVLIDEESECDACWGVDNA